VNLEIINKMRKRSGPRTDH